MSSGWENGLLYPCTTAMASRGGHHDKEAASRTNSIVEAVVQEITQRGDIYAFIVGDLNADTCDLPAVTELLQTQGWTDLGACPKWLAGRPPAPTCFVADHAGTRRDFILADARLMTMPLAFEVAEEDTFPVHKPVRMDIGHQQQPCYVYRATVPKDPTCCVHQGLDSEAGV